MQVCNYTLLAMKGLSKSIKLMVSSGAVQK